MDKQRAAETLAPPPCPWCMMLLTSDGRLSREPAIDVARGGAEAGRAECAAGTGPATTSLNFSSARASPVAVLRTTPPGSGVSQRVAPHAGPGPTRSASTHADTSAGARILLLVPPPEATGFWIYAREGDFKS